MLDTSSTATERRHHALAVPLPGQGHINPLMRFCKRLAAQEGFTITFLDIHLRPHQLEEAAEAEAEPSPASTAHEESPSAMDSEKLDIRRARLQLLLPPWLSSTSAGILEGFFTAVQTLAPEIEHVLLQRHDPPITCLISDLFVTGATQSVADKLHLPRIAFIPCSLSILLLVHHMLEGADLHLQEVMTISTLRELIRESIFKEGLQGLPTLKVDDLMENLGEDLFIYTFMSQALQETRNKAHAFVVNTFEEIERNALKVNMGAPIYAIGPLVEPLEKDISTSLLQEDDACMLWLDQQPCSSVLFISFGSFASISTTQFEELVAGLLSSQQRFLWVFCPNLLKDGSYTTFPEQLLSKIYGRGYATSWVPQVKVLSHPSIHGFLTHCGWNSTLEAMSKGVPMICFPYFGDQFMNAKLIVDEWKVGLRLGRSQKTGLVEREEVERAIRALMEEKEGEILHNNALGLKQGCDQSYMTGGHAFKNIQALVQSMACNS